MQFDPSGTFNMAASSCHNTCSAIFVCSIGHNLDTIVCNWATFRSHAPSSGDATSVRHIATLV